MKDDRGEVPYIVWVFFLNKLKTLEWLCVFFYPEWNQMERKSIYDKGSDRSHPSSKAHMMSKVWRFVSASIIIKPVYMLLILNMYIKNVWEDLNEHLYKCIYFALGHNVKRPATLPILNLSSKRLSNLSKTHTAGRW